MRPTRRAIHLKTGPWAGVAAVVLALVAAGLLVLALGLGLIVALIGAVVGGGWLAWQSVAERFGRRKRPRDDGPVVIEGRYRVVERRDE